MKRNSRRSFHIQICWTILSTSWITLGDGCGGSHPPPVGTTAVGPAPTRISQAVAFSQASTPLSGQAVALPMPTTVKTATGEVTWAATTAMATTTTTAETRRVIPVLPPDVAAEVAKDEAIVNEAWSNPNDLELAKKALPLAETALVSREKYQGVDWWETINARFSLANIKTLLRLTGPDRQTLAEAAILKKQMIEAYDLRRLEDAIHLNELACSRLRSVLGLNHVCVARAMSDQAVMLDRLGRDEQALAEAERSLKAFQCLYTGDHPSLAQDLDTEATCLRSLGRSRDALPKLEASLEMNRRLADGDSADVAESLNNLGTCLGSLGRPRDALPVLMESLEMRQRLFVGDRPEIVNSLNNVAECQFALGRLTEASTNFESAAEMLQRLRNGDDPVIAQTLTNLVRCLYSLGRYSEALPNAKAALEMYRRLIEGDSVELVGALRNIGACNLALGRPEAAMPMLEAASDMERRLSKGDTQEIARSLKEVARCLESIHRPADALRKYSEALEMQRRLGVTDQSVEATELNSIALCLMNLNRPAEALPKYEEALRLYRRIHKGDHADIATILTNKATCLNLLKRPADALPDLQSALEMDQRLFPGDRAEIVRNLHDLVVCLAALKRWEQALPVMQAALEMDQHLLKRDHPDIATDLDNLAYCQAQLGRIAEALPNREAAMKMNQRLYKSDRPEIVMELSESARYLSELGRSMDAVSKFRAALEMQTRLRPGDDMNVAAIQNNMALCLCESGNPFEALPRFESALEIWKRLLRGDHEELASGLNNEALCLDAMNRQAEALPKYQEALEIRQRLVDGDSRDIATSLNNIGGCLESLDRPIEALAKLDAALQMYQRLGTGDDENVAKSLDTEAACLSSLGRLSRATVCLAAAQQMKWRLVTRTFPALSETQKRLFLNHAAFLEGEALVCFSASDHADPSAAFDAVLMTKELLTEAARQEHAAFIAAQAYASPEWTSLWREYQEKKRSYSSLALGMMNPAGIIEADSPSTGSADPKQLRSLSDRVGELEQLLRRGNRTYAQQANLAVVTQVDVMRALPPQQSFLDYFMYHSIDLKSGRASAAGRYACFVVKDGKVSLADLGEASVIDQAVTAYRSAVIDWIKKFDMGVTFSSEQEKASELELAGLSSALRERVWDPIVSQLGSAKRVYVAPDDALSLMPFEALATIEKDGSCHYLVENKEFVYLNTGRDLARLAMTVGDDQGRPQTAVLVGNPAFDAPSQDLTAGLSAPHAVSESQGGATGGLPATQSAAADAAVIARDPEAGTLGGSGLGGAGHRQIPRNFPRNPRLAKLVDDAGELFGKPWSVTVLKDKQATEEAVLALQAPTILQFATHGYMLDKPASDAGWDNPLLRSMLILAGANKWQKESATFYPGAKGEWIAADQARKQGLDKGQGVTLGDGLLTAYMVTGMNLHGTQLVNLTACDTGVGEVTPQGVAGLRQAFLMAGARSLTASMWEVPTVETTKQMQDFYHLWLGDSHPQNRFHAFHEAQLDALAQARKNHGCGHPFFWAGVVYVGDPGDLKRIEFGPGKRAATLDAQQSSTRPN